MSADGKNLADISRLTHVPTPILSKCWLGGNGQKRLTTFPNKKAVHFPPISRKPPMFAWFGHTSPSNLLRYSATPRITSALVLADAVEHWSLTTLRA